jgi:signal transduction histidine kinase
MSVRKPSYNRPPPDTEDARAQLQRLAIVIGAIVIIAAAHHEIPRTVSLASKVIQYLFFLPIVVAAFWFGWRGGLAAAVIATLCYLPRLPFWWREQLGYSADEYGEALDLLLVGSILGLLADRERRQKNELHRTTRQLSETYRELQENFQHLKRVEQLSAIGQLSASLAHEIRNPLASIEGAADLLKPGAVPEEMREEFVGIIKKECRRLSRLLGDLLNLSRPRRPDYTSAPISEILGSVLELIYVAAQKSQVTIRTEMPHGLPPLACDPEQIKQVFLNLCMNAIQAMPGGGEMVIEVSLSEYNLVVEIRDEGPGIPSEHLHELFSPFFTTKKDGTGLGLPVAQQIVLRHGGLITAGANEPRGAVFTVTLPLQPSKVPL